MKHGKAHRQFAAHAMAAIWRHHASHSVLAIPDAIARQAYALATSMVNEYVNQAAMVKVHEKALRIEKKRVKKLAQDLEIQKQRGRDHDEESVG